jgi:subtilisin-like proprotein convertase family protein
MKKFLVLLTAACLGTSAFAQSVFTTNLTVNTSVPDNNPSGLASAFTVSGLGGTISNITVSVNITGGFNGDLFAYLTGPGGYAVLLNRVGESSTNANGYANTGFALTFLTGGPDIHSYGAGAYSTNGTGQLTGLWGADGRTNSPFAAASAFDSAARTALLDSFIGSTANGTWGFFIADYASGDIATLVSYSVSITMVPEPGTLAMLAVGAFALVTVRRQLAAK